MKNLSFKVTAGARIVLGLIFFVFGLNGFLGFLPQPELSGEPVAFLGALAASGYFFPVLKGVEILAGLALLSNRLVPLALVLLAPIVVQIGLFHLLLAGDGVAMVVFLFAAEIYLAWSYRNHFRSVLAVKAIPAESEGASASLAPAQAHG